MEGYDRNEINLIKGLLNSYSNQKKERDEHWSWAEFAKGDEGKSSNTLSENISKIGILGCRRFDSDIWRHYIVVQEKPMFASRCEALARSRLPSTAADPYRVAHYAMHSALYASTQSYPFQDNHKTPHGEGNHSLKKKQTFYCFIYALKVIR